MVKKTVGSFKGFFFLGGGHPEKRKNTDKANLKGTKQATGNEGFHPGQIWLLFDL